MMEMNQFPQNQIVPFQMTQQPLTAEEKHLALGATFYKEFARSIDNASRLIFPSSERLFIHKNI
jgi:hypothetical protein